MGNGIVSKFFPLFLDIVPEMPSKIRGGLLADSDSLLLLFFLLLLFLVVILRAFPQLFKELIFPFTEKKCDFSRNIHVSRIVLAGLIIITFFILSFFLALYFSTVLYHNRLLPVHILELSLLFSLPLFLYCVYKYVFNSVFIWVFYPDRYFNYWLQCFVSIYLLMGIVLLPFLFIALFLYEQELRLLLLGVQLVPIVAIGANTVKSYAIFFGQKRGGFHFILYLCAQEIYPLLLLGKMLDFLYNSYI